MKNLEEFKSEMVKLCPILFQKIGTKWCIHSPENTYGVNIGPGWFGLIKELCLDIEKLNRENLEKGENLFKASFVRRVRFSLRFSISSSSPHFILDNIIAIASEKSKTTCEICGSEALYRNGFVSDRKILCDYHYKETLKLIKESNQ